jgi:hypothetical protein
MIFLIARWKPNFKFNLETAFEDDKLTQSLYGGW